MNQAALGVILPALIGVSGFCFGQSGISEPLKLEATIPMAEVQGRIDHLSIDVKGQRLFVAAPGVPAYCDQMDASQWMRTIPPNKAS